TPQFSHRSLHDALPIWAIDTANQLIHYEEARVGEALQALMKKGARRESLFLQTKFTSANGQDHRTPYDRSADLTTQVKQSFESRSEEHTSELQSPDHLV